MILQSPAIFMKLLKNLLIGLGAIGLLLVIFIFIGLNQAEKTDFVSQKLVFQNKLNIPPLLQPKIENGEKIFDLKIGEGQTGILPGKQTRTLGFNGNILGPTIRVSTGDKVRMNVTNSLSEDTTVHWHGMHLPAAMDGGPHQMISPGSSWQPNWTITNQAATLWYHPHLMSKTSEQVYQGLAGVFIVDDSNSNSLNLPKDYGVDDIPLIVQDKNFDNNGQLVFDDPAKMKEITAGMLGQTVLVNGTYAPYLDVPGRLIRLRLVNGSNARRFNFGFSDSRQFYQIATDGGLLPGPVMENRLQLSPGERAEVLVDLSNQTEPITLISYPIEGDTNKVRSLVLGKIVGKTDEHEQFKILELRPNSGNYQKQEIPQVLNTISTFNESTANRTRLIKLDTAAIDGKKMDMSRIDEVVKKGDVEIWTVRNESPIYHPFHIHDVQFLVLDRNGQKPAANEAGWKDTVSLNPSDTVRIIMQFNDYADPNIPYMFHCHNMSHEDKGMMGQFVVVD
jgi:suppressor of ftsI